MKILVSNPELMENLVVSTCMGRNGDLATAIVSPSAISVADLEQIHNFACHLPVEVGRQIRAMKTFVSFVVIWLPQFQSLLYAFSSQ